MDEKKNKNTAIVPYDKMSDEDKAKVEELKIKHGISKVWVVAVQVGETDEVVTGYFRRPTTNMMDIGSIMRETKPNSAKKFIIKSCFLDGDQRIVDDEWTLDNATTITDEIISIYQAVIKKN